MDDPHALSLTGAGVTAPPSFVVEDQSEVIDFLDEAPGARAAHRHARRRRLPIRERGYKLKRAVKFPYMDFSTAERRGAMCAAEIEINQRLAPEIYLGAAPVRRRDGKLASARSVSTPTMPSTGWSSCAASTRTACSTAWPTAAR